MTAEVPSSATPSAAVVVRPRAGGFSMGTQRQSLQPLITASTAGARAISSGAVHMAPGHYTAAHVHSWAEVVVMVLEGYAATVTWDEHGEPTCTRHGPGEHAYIVPGLPHAAINLSRSRPVIALEVRTDPDFNRNVLALPWCDVQVPQSAGELQEAHVDAVRAAIARGAHSW